MCGAVVGDRAWDACSITYCSSIRGKGQSFGLEALQDRCLLGCTWCTRSSLLPLQEDHPEDWRGSWAQDPLSKRWTPQYQEYLDDPHTDFSRFELPTETHGAGEAYGEAWRPAGGHVNKAWAVTTLGESACRVSSVAAHQPHITEVGFSCNHRRHACCQVPLAPSAPSCSSLASPDQHITKTPACTGGPYQEPLANPCAVHKAVAPTNKAQAAAAMKRAAQEAAQELARAMQRLAAKAPALPPRLHTSERAVARAAHPSRQSADLAVRPSGHAR